MKNVKIIDDLKQSKNDVVWGLKHILKVNCMAIIVKKTRQGKKMKAYCYKFLILYCT